MSLLGALNVDSNPTGTRSEVPVIPDENPPVRVPVFSVLPGYSPRLAGENPEHIELLATVKNFPPILVHRRTMRVIDGMHRLRAAQLRGDQTIAVTFFEGDDAAADLCSIETNVKHGLPLSRADREAAAGRVLTLYRQWSDRAVANATGLSPTTVSAIRRRLFSSAEQEASRIGRDGRFRPVDGSAGRERASAIIARKPDASLRNIAADAGVSIGTARDVRARLRDGRSPVLRPPRDTDRKEAPVDGGAVAQRRGPHAAPAIDWPSLRGNLSMDPTVKYVENGRDFVRWADRHVVDPATWGNHIDAVPAHWRKPVAELARSCAEAWLAFAHELEGKA